MRDPNSMAAHGPDGLMGDYFAAAQCRHAPLSAKHHLFLKWAILEERGRTSSCQLTAVFLTEPQKATNHNRQHFYPHDLHECGHGDWPAEPGPFSGSDCSAPGCNLFHWKGTILFCFIRCLVTFLEWCSTQLAFLNLTCSSQRIRVNQEHRSHTEMIAARLQAAPGTLPIHPFGEGLLSSSRLPVFRRRWFRVASTSQGVDSFSILFNHRWFSEKIRIPGFKMVGGYP